MCLFASKEWLMVASHVDTHKSTAVAGCRGCLCWARINRPVNWSIRGTDTVAYRHDIDSNYVLSTTTKLYPQRMELFSSHLLNLVLSSLVSYRYNLTLASYCCPNITNVSKTSLYSPINTRHFNDKHTFFSLYTVH